jgi:membrane protease YdiL (CAAX protease family)
MPELISAVVQLLLLSVPTIVYLVVRRKRADGGRAAMGLTWGSRSDYLVAAGMAVVLIALGLGVTRLLPADVLAVAGSTNRITGVLAGVAVALRSAGEEVLFRGFLQGVVRNRFGRTAGIWVQAVLFLLLHLPLLAVSPLLWPILAVQLLTGLALGWLRARHDSIAPAIGVHVVANVVAGLVV